MANSIRPWARLASLRSSPAPIPIPESHPKLQTQPSQSAEPSLKAPQVRNTSSQDNNVIATKSLPTTPHVQSPMQSQKPKLTTPFTFPPSKLKVNHQIETKITAEQEPETMTVNMTIEKPNINGNDSLQKESGENQKRDIGHHKKQVTSKQNESIHTKLSGSESDGMRVITITGKNKGAYMQITRSQKKPIHKMENSGRKDKSGKVGTLSSPPMTAVYMNSNVQCVNNSILFGTSCTHHYPGLHLTLSNKPVDQGVDGQHN